MAPGPATEPPGPAWANPRPLPAGRAKLPSPAGSPAPPAGPLLAPVGVVPEVLTLRQALPPPAGVPPASLALAEQKAAASARTEIPLQVAQAGQPVTRAAGPTFPAAAGRSLCAGRYPPAASIPVPRRGTGARLPLPWPSRPVASIPGDPDTPSPQSASAADCRPTAEPVRAPPSRDRRGAPAARPDRRDQRIARASAARSKRGRSATSDRATSRKRPPTHPDWPIRGRTRACSQRAHRQEPRTGSPTGHSGVRRLGTFDSATFSWISPRNHDLTARPRRVRGIPDGRVDFRDQAELKQDFFARRVSEVSGV